MSQTPITDPVKVEIYINGALVGGQAFIAQELSVTESKTELHLHAVRWEPPMVEHARNPIFPEPTGTVLDGRFTITPAGDDPAFWDTPPDTGMDDWAPEPGSL